LLHKDVSKMDKRDGERVEERRRREEMTYH
jgi:hypothetical protein